MTKKVLAIILAFGLLSSTSLWAVRGYEKGRNYNRDIQKRSGQSKWARCWGGDSDGPMHATAVIQVDVETIWELQNPGVEYSASAVVSGTGSHGTYSAHAYAIGDESPNISGETNGYTTDNADAFFFDEDATVNAEDALSSINSYGKISGATSNSTPHLHKANAQAFRFSVKGNS